MIPALCDVAFFVTFYSHHVKLKATSKKFNTLDAIVCRNPFCSQGQKAFATKAALQKHLAVLLQCTRFLLNQAPSQWAQVCVQDIVNKSHKCRCVLCRDVANSINPAYLQTDYAPEPRQDVAFLPAGVIDVNDDDEYDDNANGWEDYGLVVKAPTVRLTHHTFMHTIDQKWTIDLLKVLDNMNAPDYAFGAILAWARGASADNYSFNPPMPNARHLLPTVVPIMTGGVATSTVVVFDFVPQLLSLLQNPSIMQQENLVIDVNCQLRPYSNPTTVLGEALSGSVYAEAYVHYIMQPSRQLFVLIIQSIDCTHVTGNQRFSLKPYMFTPAIFTKRFRRTIKACWGYHGFLRKVNLSSA